MVFKHFKVIGARMRLIKHKVMDTQLRSVPPKKDTLHQTVQHMFIKAP